MDMQGQGWRTLEEVAAELRASPAAVERLVAEGKIAGMEVEGTLRFRPSVVERYARRAERHAFLRRWRGRAVILAAAAVALAGVATLAASAPFAGEKVPRQLPYRGYLDQNGAPVTDPAVTMRFELFTAETGGAYAWSEEQPGISVLDGNFSVALGDVTPLPAWLFAQPSLYLAITVNGQALQGRQRLLTVPYAQYAAGSAAVPAGTVVAFAGGAVPEGWLPCTGDPFDPAVYPALQAAIGAIYGTDPGNGWPRTPDYRGRFLRGADAGSGRDADGARALGSVQEWSTAFPRAGISTGLPSGKHTHPFSDAYFAESWCGTSPGGLTGSNQSDVDNTRCMMDSVTSANTEDHTHAVLGGDVETRPANVAVSWIIKAVP